MFCKKCGTKLDDDAKFCGRCGQSCLDDELIQTPISRERHEPIDLSGQTEGTAPLEKKYNGILLGGILVTLACALLIFTGRLFHAFVMEGSREMVIMGLLIVSVPFALLSIPFVISSKKKASKTERKVGRGTAVTLYAVTWVMIASAMASGFAYAFSKIGVMPSVSIIIFAVIALVLIILCNALAHQNGEEGLYCLMKATLSGFALSSLIGYALGTVMAAMEIALVVILIALIAFFIFGGRVIFVSRN